MSFGWIAVDRADHEPPILLNPPAQLSPVFAGKFGETLSIVSIYTNGPVLPIWVDLATPMFPNVRIAVFNPTRALVAVLMMLAASTACHHCVAFAQVTQADDLEAMRAAVADDPRSVAAQKALAAAALRKQLLPEAIRAAFAATTVAPDDAEAASLLAVALARGGRFGEAIEAYETIPERAPDLFDASAAIRAARLAIQADEKLRENDEATTAQIQSASRDLEAGASLDPFNIAIKKTLAWLYLDKLSRPSNAYAYAVDLYRITPEDVDVKKLLAIASLRTGRFVEARSLLEEVVGAQPHDTWIRFNLGKALESEGAVRRAIEVYRRILEDDPDYKLASRAVRELIGPDELSPEQQQQYLDTLEDAEKALRAAVDQKSPALYATAAESFERALALNPNSAALQKKLVWLYVEKTRQPRRGLDHAQRILAREPNDLATKKLLGLAYYGLGCYEEAIRVFNAVRRVDPGDEWMEVHLGFSLARLKCHSRACAVYNHILERKPDYLYARLGIAELQAWNGKTREPLGTCLDLLEEAPDNGSVRSLLADIYRWDWNLSAAAREYAELLAQDPKNVTARRGLCETDAERSYVVSNDSYDFLGSDGFRRSFAGVGVRVPLSDRLYATPRYIAWQFQQGSINRNDFRTDFEYHFQRHLTGTAYFLDYDIEGHPATQGFGFGLKYTPGSKGHTYSLSYANNEPVLDGIATVRQNINQELVGIGCDLPFNSAFSFQSSYTDSHYSDDNIRRSFVPQLSYRIFSSWSAFFRLRYEFVNYTIQVPDYFSPADFQIVRPLFDLSYPVTDRLSFDLKAEIPYVINTQRAGHGFTLGPTWRAGRQAYLSAAYLDYFIPASALWSGRGFQLQAWLRF